MPEVDLVWRQQEGAAEAAAWTIQRRRDSCDHSTDKISRRWGGLDGRRKAREMGKDFGGQGYEQSSGGRDAT